MAGLPSARRRKAHPESMGCKGGHASPVPPHRGVTKSAAVTAAPSLRIPRRESFLPDFPLDDKPASPAWKPQARQ